MIKIQYQKTAIGEIVFGEYEQQLCLLDFRYRKLRSTVDGRLQKMLACEMIEAESSVLDSAKIQLLEFLEKKRTGFDLPLLTVGTDFQKQVWQSLLKIPYGETTSYLELAQMMGRESSVRAIANANGANAIAVIIPCHRVIGSNGELVGYGGGLPAKKRLLELENPERMIQAELALA